MSLRKGDKIEVIDKSVSPHPIFGTVLEIDGHPLDSSFAKIRVDSPALPAPEIWVNLRMARRIDR